MKIEPVVSPKITLITLIRNSKDKASPNSNLIYFFIHVIHFLVAVIDPFFSWVYGEYKLQSYCLNKLVYWPP